MSDARTISESKLVAYHQVGVKIDDLLEEYKRNLHISEGSLNQIAMVVMKSERYLAQTLEADDQKFTKDELESFKKIFEPYLAMLKNTQVNADVTYRQLQGKVQSGEQFVKELKGFFDQENLRLDRIKFLEEHPEAIIEDGMKPVPGVHPGNPLDKRRVKTSESKTKRKK